MSTTEIRLTEAAILGIDRALSFHDRAIAQSIADGADPTTESVSDLLTCLRAAQSWLMSTTSAPSDAPDPHWRGRGDKDE